MKPITVCNEYERTTLNYYKNTPKYNICMQNSKVEISSDFGIQKLSFNFDSGNKNTL